MAQRVARVRIEADEAIAKIKTEAREKSKAHEEQIAKFKAQAERIIAKVKSEANEKLRAESQERARAEAITLLKKYCNRPEAPAGTLVTVANVCRQDKDDLAAICYYRRALAQQYGQGHWRLDLARLLARTGQPRQAIHHARICLRLQPGMTQAKRLIADLSILSDVASGN